MWTAMASHTGGDVRRPACRGLAIYFAALTVLSSAIAAFITLNLHPDSLIAAPMVDRPSAATEP